ncbi:hypothetical protein Q1695_001161 [Nippostrongylus brasiliensis]|nr:hypothetical protein Q1695_001161 [Nippostrongylus brasiliensis]
MWLIFSIQTSDDEFKSSATNDHRLLISEINYVSVYRRDSRRHFFIITSYLPSYCWILINAFRFRLDQSICMFVPEQSSSIPATSMPSTKEITIVCLLFVVVIVFQCYVYLKLDNSDVNFDEIDKQRREEERKRRNDLLLKALSAF